MKLIEADHHRLYEIPGVPGPARKPVDIDASKTRFHFLRSLRIYSFEKDIEIDGHADEDEVFVVVTSGSVKMRIAKTASDTPCDYTLAAAVEGSVEPFAAYLPPHAAYQLTSLTAADVAYARATPASVRAPAVFSMCEDDGSGLLLDERSHAEILRLKVMRVRPNGTDVSLDVSENGRLRGEALVHVQGLPAEHVAQLQTRAGEECTLRSWQTVALGIEDHAVLRVADGADVLVLMVLAVHPA